MAPYSIWLGRVGSLCTQAAHGRQAARPLSLFPALSPRLEEDRHLTGAPWASQMQFPLEGCFWHWAGQVPREAPERPMPGGPPERRRAGHLGARRPRGRWCWCDKSGRKQTGTGRPPGCRAGLTKYWPSGGCRARNDPWRSGMGRRPGSGPHRAWHWPTQPQLQAEAVLKVW